MNSIGYNTERLFADICSKKYMKGFVFHSPKAHTPTEIEIGDVLIWVRSNLIVFEIISRNPDASNNLKSFTKRIGKKRDQLLRDFEFFSTLENDIFLKNEDENEVVYQNQFFMKQGFIGIALVDIGSKTLKLHYGTIEKCLEFEFPTNIIHYNGFLKVIHELDTVADVYFYFRLRINIIKYIFSKKPELVLNITEHFEANLIAFYKMNLDSFPEDKFDFNTFPFYWSIYRKAFRNQIYARDLETTNSYIIDQIIQENLKIKTPTNEGTIFAWELASLNRRQRAGRLAKYFDMANRQLRYKNTTSLVQYYNSTSGCWLIFFFNYGDSLEDFKNELQRLIRLKTIYEVENNDFEFTTFGYGYRKSALNTQVGGINEFTLALQHAKTLSQITPEEISEANDIFEPLSQNKYEIKVFPNIK